MTGSQRNAEPLAAAGRRAARREGFTFAELMGAIVVLGAILAIGMQTLSWSVRHGAAIERRRTALREAENMLERFAALGWDALTPEAAAAAELSEPARRRLPQGRLQVQVEEVPAPLAARRLTVVVTWGDRAGQLVAPVRLSTWVYRDADLNRRGERP